MAVHSTARFNDLVAEAIAASSDVEPSQIIVLDNSDKYTPEAIVPDANGHGNGTLSQIFDTMANVNRMAVESSSLCAGPTGPSFRDALLEAATQIVRLSNGKPVRYVELGPEPWKSSAILQQLLAVGVHLVQYVGVDINPESEATMRKALAPIVGEERFSYLIADFYKCSADDIPEPAAATRACITVITNLGFQEGNDLPSRIGAMLTRMTCPGDLVLSEMQVLRPLDGSASQIIRDFYHHPEMRRFSGLVGRQFDPLCSLAPCDGDSTEYVFHLVPVATEIGTVKVATTLISVHVDGVKRYVLTNSCLKFTPEQFNHAREATGQFAARCTVETGDSSVIFQIAERL